MKSVLLSLLFASTLLSCAQAQVPQTPQPIPQHRVVYQLVTSDTTSHQALIKQLNRLRDHWPTATLEVVVHGFSLPFMMTEKSVNKKGITDLMARGIDFVICENTMKREKVTKEQLLKGARTVPMGIVEIIEKQEAGYSYIKAGE